MVESAPPVMTKVSCIATQLMYELWPLGSWKTFSFGGGASMLRLVVFAFIARICKDLTWGRQDTRSPRSWSPTTLPSRPRCRSPASTRPPAQPRQPCLGWYGGTHGEAHAVDALLVVGHRLQQLALLPTGAPPRPHLWASLRPPLLRSPVTKDWAT